MFNVKTEEIKKVGKYFDETFENYDFGEFKFQKYLKDCISDEDYFVLDNVYYVHTPNVYLFTKNITNDIYKKYLIPIYAKNFIKNTYSEIKIQSILLIKVFRKTEIKFDLKYLKLEHICKKLTNPEFYSSREKYIEFFNEFKSKKGSHENLIAGKKIASKILKKNLHGPKIKLSENNTGKILFFQDDPFLRYKIVDNVIILNTLSYELVPYVNNGVNIFSLIRFTIIGCWILKVDIPHYLQSLIDKAVLKDEKKFDYKGVNIPYIYMIKEFNKGNKFNKIYSPSNIMKEVGFLL